ncbi:MAG: bifunctional phosphoribosyl-AMP cyclohydrolase/phosphoribosyl-ATP diphosphatase HisIE [Lachnospiraceae bacterium]|jgi:phosphoribosyl-ATP pyrophosphohydrolase/phosphoribosyl-AMP cyclohydrolase|nr:bifunctional phosphoribosyl-AMP cyclohydrolase/phosphoribosyl-ATP diphosphatase HisIE [Lachnospiraceae bacterium]
MFEDIVPNFKDNELIPAIVQDYRTNQVLMLAYVNQESFEKMKELGETVFYSRSRKELWHKGDTSGNFQIIKSMAIDCDADTLLIKVKQIGGGACHTGTYSCFGDKEFSLPALYDTIVDRDEHPVDNSYTNYLLEKGIDKICKKVGEEATETVIAAKNLDKYIKDSQFPADENDKYTFEKDELIGEIADLAFHTFVMMYDRGITPEDVLGKLDTRHNKSGNKKVENKKGEY